MLRLTAPSEAEVRAILASQASRDFSYPEVGATREGPARAPAAYPINLHRLPLGAGRAAYARAVAAVRDWRMYDLPWTTLVPRDAPSTPGATIAVVVRHAGLWSVNCSRVVYTIEDSVRREVAGGAEKDVTVSGFAIGTLPAHVEQGEERFTVEHRAADDSVWFEIYAFARLKHWAARAIAPVARRYPPRFAREAAVRIRRAIE